MYSKTRLYRPRLNRIFAYIVPKFEVPVPSNSNSNKNTRVYRPLYIGYSPKPYQNLWSHVIHFPLNHLAYIVLLMIT